MRIEGKVKGIVLDRGVSKKGKQFYKIYNSQDVIKVFGLDSVPLNIGDQVDLDVIIVTDSAYVVLNKQKEMG